MSLTCLETWSNVATMAAVEIFGVGVESTAAAWLTAGVCGGVEVGSKSASGGMRNISQIVTFKYSLSALTGGLLYSAELRWDITYQFLFDSSNRFGPQAHELKADPDARKAIDFVALSPGLALRLFQSESEVYDAALWKMDRKILECPARTEVCGCDWDLAALDFVAHAEVAGTSNSVLAICQF